MRFFLTIIYILGCLCTAGVLSEKNTLKPVDKVARVVLWPVLLEILVIGDHADELRKP